MERMHRSPDDISALQSGQTDPTASSRRRFGESCLNALGIGLLAGVGNLVYQNMRQEQPKSAADEFRDIMQDAALPRNERTRRLMLLFDARLERRDIGLSLRLHIAEQLMRDEHAARDIFHFLHACSISTECPAEVRLRAAHLLDQVSVLYEPSLQSHSYYAQRNARIVVDLACGRMEPQDRVVIQHLAERIGGWSASSDR